MTNMEYRVVWKHEGIKKRYRRFARKKGADRWVEYLTSKEPWKAFGLDGDAYECCSGHECGCGGMRVRDGFIKQRKDIPKLLTLEIQQREVGEWSS